MNEWIEELCDLTAAGNRVVLVTVAGIRGSSPREIGAKMIVTSEATVGTIGGGQLEYQCTRIASDMLDAEEQAIVRKFSLGASMGQCCGGVVDILFEPISSGLPPWLQDIRGLHGQREQAAIVTGIGPDARKFVVTADNQFGGDDEDVSAAIVASTREGLADSKGTYRVDDWFVEAIIGSDFNIAVFGAGHVGSAVVVLLSSLDCNIRWIDSRRNIFRNTPSNVRAIESSDPALEVAAMPLNSCYLVMTHSHAIDFEICDRILRRGDATYCGLIGSVSKRRRFEKRYREQGMLQSVIDRLVCPIGIDGISGKKPAEIAVSAAAEVLRAYELAARRSGTAYPDNVLPIRQ
ncbi:MAG: xanthine dehydrogenase accessory protein XdhC [Desulfobulbaceae bacterium]|nr:xanthine dehydrogenase accessory protein XdhC [Desulfobulbaceae bacterium]